MCVGGGHRAAWFMEQRGEAARPWFQFRGEKGRVCVFVEVPDCSPVHDVAIGVFPMIRKFQGWLKNLPVESFPKKGTLSKKKSSSALSDIYCEGVIKLQF